MVANAKMCGPYGEASAVHLSSGTAKRAEVAASEPIVQAVGSDLVPPSTNDIVKMDIEASYPNRTIHDGASGKIPSIFESTGCFAPDEGFESSDVQAPSQGAGLGAVPMAVA